MKDFPDSDSSDSGDDDKDSGPKTLTVAA